MTYETTKEILENKANFFMKRNERVHISYKNGGWKRGYITGINSDFIMIDETLEGTIPVFFIEIKDIDKYHIKGVGDVR